MHYFLKLPWLMLTRGGNLWPKRRKGLNAYKEWKKRLTFICCNVPPSRDYLASLLIFTNNNYKNFSIARTSVWCLSSSYSLRDVLLMQTVKQACNNPSIRKIKCKIYVIKKGIWRHEKQGHLLVDSSFSWRG